MLKGHGRPQLPASSRTFSHNHAVKLRLSVPFPQSARPSQTVIHEYRRSGVSTPWSIVLLRKPRGKDLFNIILKSDFSPFKPYVFQVDFMTVFFIELVTSRVLFTSTIQKLDKLTRINLQYLPSRLLSSLIYLTISVKNVIRCDNLTTCSDKLCIETIKLQP